jgi:DNA-binding CsgD family transcriptional regulator
MGRRASSHEWRRKAEEASAPSIEVDVYVAAGRALLLGDDERGDAYRELWTTVTSSGNIDGFVLAYRIAPELLRVALKDDLIDPPDLLSVLTRAEDHVLAQKLGLAQPDAELLSRREREVAALLREGLSNREIADRLVISPATAKVHVRHIYEKLGIRNRAEAVARLSSLD